MKIWVQRIILFFIVQACKIQAKLIVKLVKLLNYTGFQPKDGYFTTVHGIPLYSLTIKKEKDSDTKLQCWGRLFQNELHSFTVERHGYYPHHSPVSIQKPI